MDSNKIQNNDFVLLVLDDKRRWLIQVREGKDFHTHRGLIDFNEVIGKSFGSCIFSKPYNSQGYKFFLLKPFPSDFILNMRRKTQIIYPKDAGLILLYSGISSGSMVLEAGTGSGALTCIIGSYIRPGGHVYSFDIRKKSLEQAKRNIRNANLEEYVTIEYGNVLEEEIPYMNLDSVILDLSKPWKAIPNLKKNLKLSGSLLSFSPVIEQAKKTTFALQENDFFDIETVELIERKMQIRRNATRPMSRMVGHSGYLTFGRKIEDKKNPYREVKPKDKEFVDLKGMPLRRIEDD